MGLAPGEGGMLPRDKGWTGFLPESREDSVGGAIRPPWAGRAQGSAARAG